MLYPTRIQAIRAFYARLAPDQPWFADAPTAAVASGTDAAGAALRSTGMRPGFGQMLFTRGSAAASSFDERRSNSG
jgi:hypothetical protein